MFTFANFFRFLIIGKLLGLSIDPTIYKGKLDFSIIWPAIAAEKNCTLLWFVASLPSRIQCILENEFKSIKDTLQF